MKGVWKTMPYLLFLNVKLPVEADGGLEFEV